MGVLQALPHRVGGRQGLQLGVGGDGAECAKVQHLGHVAAAADKRAANRDVVGLLACLLSGPERCR